MPVQKIGSMLLAANELAALSGKARRLAQLQQVYFDSAPAPLAAASRVGYFRAGTLFLLADNAAVAAKLRQLAPRLLTTIRKQESQVTGIRVEVQVGEPYRRVRRAPEKPSLPVEIIENFRKLAERVSDPELKSALANFARGSTHSTSHKRSAR
jgi:hypothetical protein